MIKFPMKFEVEARGPSGIGSPWTAKAEQLPSIQCAIPKEFAGPGGGYSPEDLFALAVLSCLIATYKVYCEKEKITFDEIQGTSAATADKSPQGQGFLITHIEIHVIVKGSSDSEKAKKLLEMAIRDCAIGNSIKSSKTFHSDVS